MEEKEEKINSHIYVGIGLATLVVISIAIIWYSIDVFLLFFASILLAIFLRSLSDPLSQKFKIPGSLFLSLVIFSLIAISVLFISLLIPTISDQINELTKELPEAWNKLSQNIQSYLQWKPIASIANSINDLIPKDKDILIKATNLFSTTFGFIGSVIIFIFIGIFLAYDPHTYKNGFLRLIPIRKRTRISEILDKITEVLRGWLLVKLFSMVLIGVLISLGLAILGVPLAITLGLIAAILSFIPNVGPIVAAIPAILIAASQGLNSAIYVTLLYIGIQTIEAYFITPAIQQKFISLPPALIISSQVLMTILTGILGLALAPPLTAALVVLIRMLYIEDVLNDYKENKEYSEG